MVKLAVSNTLAIFGGSGVGGKTTTTASPKTNKGQKHPQTHGGYHSNVWVMLAVVLPFVIKAETPPPPHFLLATK